MRHLLIRYPSSDGQELVKASCGGKWDSLSNLTPYHSLVICKACKALMQDDKQRKAG